jgi:hypothetical protein
MEILELFKQHSQVAFPIGFGGDMNFTSIYSAVIHEFPVSMPEGFLRYLP